ncbi:MAG: CoA ester lyase [Pseudomonadota bacterium]
MMRSFLFAPGSHPRRVEKALALAADAVILDLEDAVALAEKEATRAPVVTALQAPRPAAGYVRINALSTPYALRDLLAVVRGGVDGIVLPKVESAQDVVTAAWLITQVEREQSLPQGSVDLMPLIETARGIEQVSAIASASARVQRLAFGAGDFTLDLGVTWTRDEVELMPARLRLVEASRAANLEPPIDTVWIELADEAGFAASVARCKALGFQGKLCIHPAQVPVTNAAFTPDAEEVAHARRIIDAFKAAEREGLASIQIDGRFYDYPIVERCERTVALAERLVRSSGS